MRFDMNLQDILMKGRICRTFWNHIAWYCQGCKKTSQGMISNWRILVPVDKNVMPNDIKSLDRNDISSMSSGGHKQSLTSLDCVIAPRVCLLGGCGAPDSLDCSWIFKTAFNWGRTWPRWPGKSGKNRFLSSVQTSSGYTVQQIECCPLSSLRDSGHLLRKRYVHFGFSSWVLKAKLQWALLIISLLRFIDRATQERTKNAGNMDADRR